MSFPLYFYVPTETPDTPTSPGTRTILRGPGGRREPHYETRVVETQELKTYSRDVKSKTGPETLKSSVRTILSHF